MDGDFIWSRIKTKDILLVPNLITLLRLFLLPFIFFFLLKNTPSDFRIAVVLMGIAYFSDIFDGYFARKLNQESELGRILDPLVDKLAVGSVALYTVIYRGFPLWALILLITKDVLIVIGGWYLLRKRKIVPQPNRWGKYTVSLWGVVLFLYLVELSFWRELLLWLGVLMISITLFTYFRKFLTDYSSKASVP